MPDAPHPLEKLRQDAWIGDAVLELYVRSWVLRHHGAMDAEMKTRFTCNQFLNCFGNPTKVEADIGVDSRAPGAVVCEAGSQSRAAQALMWRLTRQGRTYSTLPPKWAERSFPAHPPRCLIFIFKTCSPRPLCVSRSGRSCLMIGKA
jgi:hypothetical protein